MATQDQLTNFELLQCLYKAHKNSANIFPQKKKYQREKKIIIHTQAITFKKWSMTSE